SHELSDGGASFEACASPPPWGEGEPVCDPMPARPLPMPGLSRSASESSSTGISGRDALARVGLAGSFFECLAGSRLGRFAMPTIWVESVGRKSRHSGARAIAREPGIHSPSAGIISGLAAVAAIRNDGYSNLMPARLITSPHFFESEAMVAANSSGVPPAGSSPIEAKRVLKLCDAIARLMAALSLSMIGRGTPAGAITPAQVAAE